MERVQKIIAQSGLCSRRKAEELIKEGKVKVNNKLITIGDQADAQKDTITVNNKPLEKEKPVYYMLNKPRDYITTSSDLFNRKKVLDLLPKSPRVFSVGRLDRYATGLLLLTNDGEFANKVMHPRYETSKTYLVTLDKPLSKKDEVILQKGIKIDKTVVKSQVVILEPKIVAVTVHVGLHKVVKRLFKELGYFVKQLHRTHIGNLAIDIEEGQYRLLTQQEIKLLFEKPKIFKKTFLDS